MTDNPINKDSLEYKKGYEMGQYHAGIVGIMCVVTVGLGIYVGDIHIGIINKKAGIEQKVGSDEYIKFLMNPDKESEEQMYKGCIEPWLAELNKCNNIEGVIYKEENNIKYLDSNTVDKCMVPHKKRMDECVETIYRNAFKRYQEQRNIPLRR